MCAGLTPLMHAVKTGELDTVKELMNLDAHLNHVDNKKWSAMHYAAYVALVISYDVTLAPYNCPPHH